MRTIKYLYILPLILIIISCSDFMDPNKDNYKSEDLINRSRNDFMGVLYNAYTILPNRIDFSYEAATDNAVTNNENTNPSKAARGGISIQNNPLGDTWSRYYGAINSVNWYISRMVLNYNNPIPTPVRFDIDPEVNIEYFYFTLGEAYFMRAWFQFQLLQKYGGVGKDGKVYGFPISTTYLEANQYLDLPRDTYDNCVRQIVADCDSAYKYLPLNYTKEIGRLSEGIITEAGHASGLAALTLKARTCLYAASPAYNPENDADKWRRAAKAGAEAIDKAGFTDLLPFDSYFNKDRLNDKSNNNPDIIFRGPISQNVTTYESENFPPRAGSGGGYINPSRNLVDAFLMADGYPRTSPSPEYPYNPSNVVSNRDPRLDLFIVRNGESFGGISIDTYTGGADAFGSNERATRSGYYLQKLLDPKVRINTGSVITTTHAPILLGKPELYLNFAEAAIHATGSPDDRRFGFSAREVLAKVRDRALGNGKDKYLPKMKQKQEFIDIIKNERRIELCFEDHRFWDLRRWSKGVSDMVELNAPVYSIYSENVLEERSYRSPYMPLPYSEILKTSNLVNNMGWD